MTIQLYQGDCLSILPSIPDKSIDLILCDLPFGTTRNAWDSIIPLEPLWAEYKRICRGAIVLHAAQPFTSVLICSNLDMYKYLWVWEKSESTGFLNAKRQPLRAHEDICVFYKKQPTYNPQMTKGTQVRVVQRKPGTCPNYGSMVSATSYSSDQRYPRSVLKFAKDCKNKKLHPTQKPIALAEYLIRTYTNEGDTVLDNCFGSGTTGVACVNTGRHFIGIERDPTYFAAGSKRIADAQATLQKHPTT